MDDDRTLHAGTLVRLAVVTVGASLVKLVGHLFARAVQVVLVGDGVGVDALRHVVFVEDDVVRERLVVDEFNGLTSLDGDGRRLRAREKINPSSVPLHLQSSLFWLGLSASSSSPTTSRDSPPTPLSRSVSPPPESPRARRVVVVARVASPSTHEEAEFAVVTAELDRGRERRGGHREGGRRDDGSLRATHEPGR